MYPGLYLLYYFVGWVSNSTRRKCSREALPIQPLSQWWREEITNIHSRS